MCEMAQLEVSSCCYDVTDTSGMPGNVWMELLGQTVLYVNIVVQCSSSMCNQKPRVMHILAAYYRTRLTTFPAL